MLHELFLTTRQRTKIRIASAYNITVGRGFTLFISNEDINDITKIIKSLEDSGVIIDGVTETVKHEMKKNKRVDFLELC